VGKVLSCPPFRVPSSAIRPPLTSIRATRVCSHYDFGPGSAGLGSNTIFMVPPKGIGIVETKHVTFTPPGGFELECGEKLETVTLAYETYGRLNAERTNAVLVLHALSGDAHAAGYHKGAKKPGWWDEMIGPGRAFDTEKYFVICSNVLGGCKGSTGPSSINPKTQRPYGLDFPLISVGDMVNCQALLVDHFGIDRLLSVAGGSMGGMQVIGWLVNHPHRLRSAIPISTAIRHSPQQIAFNEVGRQAIMADPALEVRQLLRRRAVPRARPVGCAHGRPHYLHERYFDDPEIRAPQEAGPPAAKIHAG